MEGTMAEVVLTQQWTEVLREALLRKFQSIIKAPAKPLSPPFPSLILKFSNSLFTTGYIPVLECSLTCPRAYCFWTGGTWQDECAPIFWGQNNILMAYCSGGDSKISTINTTLCDVSSGIQASLGILTCNEMNNNLQTELPPGQ